MFHDNDINTLIESISTQYYGGMIIPLDKFHADDWLSAGLYTEEFVSFFRDYPYSEDETDLYKWTIRKVDGLINLRIYRK